MHFADQLVDKAAFVSDFLVDLIDMRSKFHGVLDLDVCPDI
jgi:hypothetical protein